MMFYDWGLLLFLIPGFALSMLAQFMVRSAYAKAQRAPAALTGFAAARRILDDSGLPNVDIEQVPGHLSDHYDPRAKVLRLSPEVFHGQTLAAVGIAAHEAGHAIQDARQYAPLAIRNAAVPAANFGSSAGLLLAGLGYFFSLQPLLLLGIIIFSAVVFFQIVNLPVEFDASARAKVELVNLGIVNQYDMGPVNKVLRAAALTYVAATLQAVLTLLYYVLRYAGGDD